MIAADSKQKIRDVFAKPCGLNAFHMVDPGQELHDNDVREPIRVYVETARGRSL